MKAIQKVPEKLWRKGSS